MRISLLSSCDMINDNLLYICGPQGESLLSVSSHLMTYYIHLPIVFWCCCVLFIFITPLVASESEWSCSFWLQGKSSSLSFVYIELHGNCCYLFSSLQLQPHLNTLRRNLVHTRPPLFRRFALTLLLVLPVVNCACVSQPKYAISRDTPILSK